MSKLILSGRGRRFEMNVIAFSSPIYGQINSVQTKTMAVHFPIKPAQPGLQLDVQFPNELAFEDFQRFVRDHQQTLAFNSEALVTLNWPERSILNVTGFIPSFRAGGMRWNTSPRARFTINLVDSMTTSRTDLASVAANWRSIYGGIGMPNGATLQLPTAAEVQQNLVDFGQNLLNGGLPNVVNTILSGTGL